MEDAEFDRYATDYDDQHRRNIAITGEDPDYFARYKIEFLRELVTRYGLVPRAILDFGSGTGNSIPYFRAFLGQAALTCTDVSQASVDLSRKRFPGPETYALVGGHRIPLGDDGFDLTFSSCVFHHIDHAEHRTWLGELLRVTRPGGRIVIFEHNPYNPLTVRAVRTCPFDENARLITARALAQTARHAGWTALALDYHVFFPRALAPLRGLEPYMRWFPIGAQYSISARKPVA